MDLSGNLKNKNLIAISGKKQSGKNAIAKIINQLTNNKYEEKCFAYKLKDIICILIGCTREQLENESFKSKELGKEWWYWYMELDGGYSPIILDYLTTTKKQLKNYEGLELIKPTPRFLLQSIGTNLFRNQLHPEIWVNALMSEYQPSQLLVAKIRRKGFGISPQKLEESLPNWIITDMRFLNEMEAVKSRKGITIRVNRNLEESKNQHESETELDSAEFDYVIDNNGTIEELIEKVREILIKEKLI